MPNHKSFHNRVFHKDTKLAIMAILHSHKFQFPPFLHDIMLVNVKLDINGYKRIVFQDCKLCWSSFFVMAQPE